MKPEELFGPDYEAAEQEVVGALQISNKPVDVVYQQGPMKMNLLPIGGYVIRYIEGSFVTPIDPSEKVVGGEHGLLVRWKSSISNQWSELPFPCESHGKQRFVGTPQFYLETTRPHRFQLVPPDNAHGCVKVRVLRYVPRAVQESADGH